MGCDKADIVWQGQTVLERLAAAALTVAPTVLIIGRDKPHDWALPGVDFYRDQRAGLGPIGGLATAFDRTDDASVLPIACDMPLLSASSIQWLINSAANFDQLCDGVIVRNGDEIEPLFSIYSRSITNLIEYQIERGQRSLQKLISAGSFNELTAPARIARELINFNTPDDWSQLLPAK
jgi:molybdopterin-guanine dinucleotide biosynthesis protein A